MQNKKYIIKKLYPDCGNLYYSLRSKILLFETFEDAEEYIASDFGQDARYSIEPGYYYGEGFLKYDKSEDM